MSLINFKYQADAGQWKPKRVFIFQMIDKCQMLISSVTWIALIKIKQYLQTETELIDSNENMSFLVSIVLNVCLNASTPPPQKYNSSLYPIFNIIFKRETCKIVPYCCQRVNKDFNIKYA